MSTGDTSILRPLERRQSDDGSAGPRILLYSHDSAGLGHLRRCLTLADALVAAMPSAMILLVSGSPCATAFPTPPRVEIVKLPSISKDGSGAYVSRSLPTSLSFSLRMRRALLREAMETFEPDLMVVDHQVIGLQGEFLPLLEAADTRGIKTILGLRDIIDSPEAVAREWSGEETRWALREAYDRVCVYGSRDVFDTEREYPMPPELGERVEFTGYVVRPTGARPPAIPSLRPEVLVTAGGGEDGAQRIDAYLRAIEDDPPSWDSVIVTGPLMSVSETRRLVRRARLTGTATVHRFHADLPRLLQRAQAVVSMAGYNTCAEILACRRRCVLLPRTFPRYEQLIRAERLQSLGLARNLPHFDARLVREATAVAVEEALSGKPLPLPPSLEGASNLALIAAELLGESPISPSSASEESLVS